MRSDCTSCGIRAGQQLEASSGSSASSSVSRETDETAAEQERRPGFGNCAEGEERDGRLASDIEHRTGSGREIPVDPIHERRAAVQAVAGQDRIAGMVDDQLQHDVVVLEARDGDGGRTEASRLRGEQSIVVEGDPQ